MDNLVMAGVYLQPRQLAASAAARACDAPGGPTAVGYGGARGGGKSHWLLAQMGADDCQRVHGLKCLLLRKIGKSNTENLDDLRRRVFPALKHTFNSARGTLTFENGSRIVARHYQHEKEIDAFLGLQYDVIGIEEATTMTWRKYQDITTCCRSSKPAGDRGFTRVVDYEKLSGDRVGETSETIRARMQAARDIQNKRFSVNGSSDIVCNTDMRVGEILQFTKLQDEGQSLIRAAVTQLNLSARAYHRILKLSRADADLAAAKKSGLSIWRRRCNITEDHVQYHMMG